MFAVKTYPLAGEDTAGAYHDLVMSVRCMCCLAVKPLSKNYDDRAISTGFDRTQTRERTIRGPVD